MMSTLPTLSAPLTSPSGYVSIRVPAEKDGSKVVIVHSNDATTCRSLLGTGIKTEVDAELESAAIALHANDLAGFVDHAIQATMNMLEHRPHFYPKVVADDPPILDTPVGTVLAHNDPLLPSPL